MVYTLLSECQKVYTLEDCFIEKLNSLKEKTYSLREQISAYWHWETTQEAGLFTT